MPALHDLAANSYGGDEAGLICGYLFDAAAPEPVRAIDSAQAAAWLDTGASPSSDSAFLWLHFNLSHAQAERWLLRHAQ
ncbi:magnesium transporter CorA, partial [Pseudoxanthomonas sp. SGD-10]